MFSRDESNSFISSRMPSRASASSSTIEISGASDTSTFTTLREVSESSDQTQTQSSTNPTFKVFDLPQIVVGCYSLTHHTLCVFGDRLSDATNGWGNTHVCHDSALGNQVRTTRTASLAQTSMPKGNGHEFVAQLAMSPYVPERDIAAASGGNATLSARVARRSQ